MRNLSNNFQKSQIGLTRFVLQNYNKTHRPPEILEDRFPNLRTWTELLYDIALRASRYRYLTASHGKRMRKASQTFMGSDSPKTP